MNAKKGIGNIVTSMVSQLVTLLLGIIVPRLILVNLGSEANGLMSTVNQVLVYVALLEAGVGTASIQALYKPIAQRDRESVSAILSATDRFYKRSGTIYFAVVVLLTFIFPFTFDTSIPRTDVMLVMLLSGLPGVINYYFQGKFKILLQAEGKNYVLTNLTTVINVFTSISKIVLLSCGFDIVALQVMYLFFNIFQMLFIVIYMKRNYKWLDLKVKPDYDAISQSRNVVIHHISGLIFNNTDTLVLTYFCGLASVSVYAMYTMLFGIISGLISHFGGFNFILGQTFDTDRERYMKLHDLYEVFNMTLTFSLYCIAGIFILPFMTLYTAGITDVSYVDSYLPYLFIATHLLSNGRSSFSQAISYARHFKQTQWRSILESAINITVSLVAVKFLGIYGVLIGTIAALLYRTNDMIIYANKKILNRNPWITYRRWLVNLAVFVAVTFAADYLFSVVELNTYSQIIFWAVICCIVVIPVFFIIAFLFNRDVYRFAVSIIKPYIKSAAGKLFRRNSSD